MSEIKYTGKEIEHIMLLAQDVISLNTPITNKGETQDTEVELCDFIEDPNPTPEEEAIITDRREIIASYIKKYLSPREQKVITLRFGLDNGQPMTLDEVGREYGITRERVRQVEEKAMRKLRFQFAKNKITWENI